MKNDPPTTGPPVPQADPAFERQLREMNEALLVSSVRQHELAEQAKNAETAMRNSETCYRRLFESARTASSSLMPTPARSPTPTPAWAI